MEEFVMGSSKPKIETTLSDQVHKHITSDLCFKHNGKIIKVVSITEKYIKISEGEFLFPSKDTDWNISFNGDAMVGVSVENGIITNRMKFHGYARKNKEGQIEKMSDIILK